MEKEFSIYERLAALARSDAYPYHMPGHKRNPKAGLPGGFAELDITEIEYFDNLHHAQGILKDAMEEAAAFYGADKTYFLINGSTCGVLAAIDSVIPRGGTLILGRNAHVSAYHAAYLRDCRVVSLYPELLKEYGVYGAVSIAETERLLQRHPEAKAVCITSPTYDGIVSDVKALAALVHAYGKILIVDEAHGAHFGMDARMPENGVFCGADLVIHSLHKTLPSLTQTALLHVKGSRVNRERLERFLRIYQSSSPSYLLMGSIDHCIRQMREHRGEWLDSFLVQREKLLKELSTLRVLRVVHAGDGNRCAENGRSAETAFGNASVGFDPSKLMIFCGGAGMTGVELQRVLLEKYHLQMEMAGEDYVLAILTVMDTREGYIRLAKALKEIDAACVIGQEKSDTVTGGASGQKESGRTVGMSLRQEAFADAVYAQQRQERAMPLAQAMDADEVEAVALEHAKGRIVTEFVYAYPPGISVILPGELLTEQTIALIKGYRDKGLTVQGPADETLRTVRCVKQRA